MNINDYKNLGQDFRERNEGNSGWKNFWIGIAATAVGGIAIGFGKKIGQKAVDCVLSIWAIYTNKKRCKSLVLHRSKRSNFKSLLHKHLSAIYYINATCKVLCFGNT